MVAKTEGRFRHRQRRVVNCVALGMCTAAALAAIAVLVVVVGYTLVKGISYINFDFITQTAAPLGEPGGGMRNEIIGSGILVGLAAAIGLPLGIAAGAFLAEFGNGRTGDVVRTAADVMSGVPSVVIGIFAYAILVKPLGSFSALSGGIALAIIMLPVVARTTEEMMRFVPGTYREAGLALGIPMWRVILSVVMPGARAGMITGAVLGIARIGGETAPLIFTALGNRFGFAGLMHPIAALPLQIWRYAISPYDSWHKQAWAASFLLVMLVLLVNVILRLVTARYSRGA